MGRAWARFLSTVLGRTHGDQSSQAQVRSLFLFLEDNSSREKTMQKDLIDFYCEFMYLVINSINQQYHELLLHRWLVRDRFAYNIQIHLVQYDASVWKLKSPWADECQCKSSWLRR